MYIYEQDAWPEFHFDLQNLSSLLESCHIEQGRLLSKMEMLGLSEKEDKVLATVTSDVIKSSEIEGYVLNKEQVRSSIARRLGLECSGLVASDRNIDAVVEMMLDATQNYENPLTKKRLFGWHACLFPTGYSGMYKIDVGQYRKNPMHRSPKASKKIISSNANGPLAGRMQVVSGGIGQEKIHYEAPASEKVSGEMKRFLDWLNNASGDSYINAAIAHLWFVTIHPFDDGNGRIARTISDMLLCRGDRTSLRFYSLSAEILKEKNAYYDILERTQKGNLDISDWIDWFLNCILRAIKDSYAQTDSVLKKYSFLQSVENVPLNERQRLMLNKFLSPEWFGVLNSSKWAKIAKCSTDTALRDITDLIAKGILKKSQTSSGRSTNYVLVDL